MTVTGRVRVAGSTPFEQVLIEPADTAQSAVEAAGEYRDELRRLAGAKVRATGRLTAAPMADRLAVSDYSILEIAGHTPYVGTLEVGATGAAVRTADGVGRPMTGAPAELLKHAGAKVWVILDSNGAVKGYGIIRER